MPLGERILGRIRHGLHNPLPSIIFGDSFETGDLSLWYYGALGPPYVSVVTSLVYTGTYAAKLWTNTTSITPNLVKMLPASYDTLYFRSYIQFNRMPNVGSPYVASLAREWALPWGWLGRTLYVGIGKSDTKYYWSVNYANTTTEVQAGVWYKILLMSSIMLGKRRVWINDVLLKELTGTPPSISALGFQNYPTGGPPPPMDDAIYIDDVAVSDLPII